MTSFLLEAYTPTSQPLGEIEERARQAAVALTRSGVPVTYVRSIFIPEDELCLHLLDGPSRGAIADVARMAEISPVRIVEAMS